MVDDRITVQIVYALPGRQELLSLPVPRQTTIAKAIYASGLLQKFPEIDLQTNKVGIFGKIVKLDTPLKDRDRIEIYRSLVADPKEARRKRVKKRISK